MCKNIIRKTIPILDDSRKEKLIEILLIMGSILAAFNLPKDLIWLFMFFLLMSVMYFIYLKEPKMKKFNSFLLFISVLISFSFIGVVIYNFAISLIGSNPPQLASIDLILCMIYYIIFGLILTAALYRR